MNECVRVLEVGMRVEVIRINKRDLGMYSQVGLGIGSKGTVTEIFPSFNFASVLFSVKNQINNSLSVSIPLNHLCIC